MATMLNNLLDLASPAIVSALSRQTAESESRVSRGLGAAIPAIASAIASRSDDEGFVKELAGLATRAAAGPDPLETVNALVSSPTGIDTTTPIGGWVSSLFGHNLSEVTNSIARHAGISGGSAVSLLSTAAPLVLGHIGRLIRSNGLSVAGLADLLRGRRAELASSLPTGFKMPEVFRAPHETVRKAGDERSSIGWTASLALLAILGIGGLIWWANQKPREVARVGVVEPLSKAVGTTGTLAGKARENAAGGATITIPAPGSAKDRLSMYLESARAGATPVNVERITFDTGSEAPTAETSERLHNIAAILRAYPRAHVTIAGHTDSVGNEAMNVVLSRARANTVAARLTADGVSPERVHAEGHGSQKPVADNMTDAGRAQNRRVELEVTVR